jgi:hypothetical protein
MLDVTGPRGLFVLRTHACGLRAAAWLAALQVKLLLGFHVPRHSSCLQTARYLVAHIGETVPLELALGLAWLAVLLTMKHLGKTRRCSLDPARSECSNYHPVEAGSLIATQRFSSARKRCPGCRRLKFLRPLGPLTVAVLSVACVAGLGVEVVL